MAARRMIFVTAPRMGGLWPIYAAFIVIALGILLGLALALWPREPAPPAAYRPVGEESVPSSGGAERGLLVPSRARDPRGRTTSM